MHDFLIFSRYLIQNPDNKALYPKLKNVDLATLDMNCSDSGFESTAAIYLKVCKFSIGRIHSILCKGYIHFELNKK